MPRPRQACLLLLLLTATSPLAFGVQVGCTESQILNALASVNSSGGTITFNCANTTIPMSGGLGDIRSNVVIDGQGKNITLEYVTDFRGCAPANNGIGGPPIARFVGTNSAVRGLRFLNYLESLRMEAPGNRVENNVFLAHNCSDDGVSLMSLTATNSIIRGNEFRNYVDNALQMGLGGGLIEDNLFVDCGYPIRAPFGNQAGGPVYVRDNVFTTTGSKSLCQGPFFDGTYVLEFSGNTVQCRRGLRIGGDTEAIIRNNTIVGNDTVGIRLSGNASASIEGNVIKDNGYVPTSLPAGGVVLTENTKADLGGGMLTIGGVAVSSGGNNQLHDNAVADARNLSWTLPVLPAERNCWDGDDPSSIQGDIEGEVDFSPYNGPGVPEVCDGLDNNCNGLVDEESDADADGIGDCLDNCPGMANPGQQDKDRDQVGDLCDLDDGLLFFNAIDRDWVSWQDEIVYEGFNLYRGEIGRLPQYIQPSGGTEAAQFCGGTESYQYDPFIPLRGEGVFYLVQGYPGGDLGTDSDGNPRSIEGGCF